MMGLPDSISSSPNNNTPTTTRPGSSTGPYGRMSQNGQAPRGSMSDMRSASRQSVESGSGVMSTTTAVKCEVMIQYLRQRQMEKLWTDGSITEGVVLKRAKNDFVCQPPELAQQLFGFFDEIRKLNVKVCLVYAYAYFS